MTDRSRVVSPFVPEPTDINSLEWISRELSQLSNVISDLTDGTGSKLKWFKIVGSVDGTTYTVGPNEHVILVDADSANMVLNLPAGRDRQRLHIKNVSTAGGGGHNVTVTPNGSEQIDNAASYTLIKNEAISPLYVALDTNWYIL